MFLAGLGVAPAIPHSVLPKVANTESSVKVDLVD
jgi:hypothetical protein